MPPPYRHRPDVPASSVASASRWAVLALAAALASVVGIASVTQGDALGQVAQAFSAALVAPSVAGGGIPAPGGGGGGDGGGGGEELGEEPDEVGVPEGVVLPDARE